MTIPPRFGKKLWSTSTKWILPTFFVVMIERDAPFEKGFYGLQRRQRWILDGKLVTVRK
jgi:hypothetical protein